jgi:hypothetical protein
MKGSKNYQIIGRECGTIICRNLTIEEAETLVARYEMEDISNDEFDENFYQIQYDFEEFLKNNK